MSDTAPAESGSIPWFQMFKYSVYVLLILNLILFFIDDWEASAHLFTGGISWSQLIEGYATTIDTAFWILLLLAFELETWVLSDEKLKGGLKWLLGTVKVVSYCVIAYAVYGYVSKYVLMSSFELSALTDVCAQAANQLSFMIELDDYVTLAPDNCAALSTADQLLSLPGTTIISDTNIAQQAQWLALIDVVNAADWLLVVVILGLDIWLQTKGQLTGHILRISGAVKALLYVVLLVCAVLWGLDGEFLDFWDAFLWIVAFAFIEMNLFEWHAESEGETSVIGAHTIK